MSDFSFSSRQQFRSYFQPSRVLIAIVPVKKESKEFNAITVCFDMHCSYRPPMMAIAVQRKNASYEHFRRATEYTLAVPGESMAEEAMFCGTNSFREINKIKFLDMEFVASKKIRVPGLAKAIANIEMSKEFSRLFGDHLLVVGKVCAFTVNAKFNEKPLLSIGPRMDGYKLLLKQGIHRLAVVK